ncbi:hypothetical protein MS2017_0198 [Bathymodiolus thermophilus thioautotrophic gill symbiont]|uniref:Uncharacterized protein n=1 Tax=Bathymodiolus thermophilus thioautotrophic gill symbiont TaxID=2360 RepID=A0A3G3IJN0_9GAMM|nr:hypothetical protein MS2017_0198 [Bathymodiolus thermophilus thioautotrophic gill symbiont]
MLVTMVVLKLFTKKEGKEKIIRGRCLFFGFDLKKGGTPYFLEQFGTPFSSVLLDNTSGI